MDAVALQLDNMINGISDLIEDSGEEEDTNDTDWDFPVPVENAKRKTPPATASSQPGPAPVASTSAIPLEGHKNPIVSPAKGQARAAAVGGAASPPAPVKEPPKPSKPTAPPQPQYEKPTVRQILLCGGSS